MQLVGPPRPQPQHHGGAEGAGGFPLPLCGREPDRLGHAEAAAVFAEALHIQHLIEGKVYTLALQGAFSFCPPGAENVQRPLGHRLGIQDLEVVEGGCPGNVQDGRRRRRKGQLTFHRDELVEHGRAADALQCGQLLLDAAVGQRREHLGLLLSVDRRHQTKGSPHLDAAGRDRAAVQVFGLALHLRRPCSKGKLRQFQHLVEGQLLLRLAEARVILALVIHDAAQIAFQRQFAGLQLLLQHHRFRKAFDQLEHRRKIIGDQDLRFQRELRLDGAVRTRSGQRIPKDLQFHPVRSFPVRLA